MLKSGEDNLFESAINILEDLEERVIFVKNMEVFNDKIIDICLEKQKIILSGDIDKCNSKKRILDKNFKTTILFSKSEVKMSVSPPKMEKYTGYWVIPSVILIFKSKSGIIPR